MPIPFTAQDLSRIFDSRMLTRGRTLGLTGGVEVQLEGDAITGIVQDRGIANAIRNAHLLANSSTGAAATIPTNLTVEPVKDEGYIVGLFAMETSSVKPAVK